MHVADPVLSLTIKPKDKLNLNKFLQALQRFQREDPSFRVMHNVETEEVMILGMGELHLEIYGERIRREYGIPVDLGNPTVNYRETVTEKCNFNYLHKKQTGGAGQFARVIGYIEPTFTDITDPKNDQSCEFKDATIGTNIPNEYLPAIEKAFHDAVKKGPFTGFPVVGVRYVLEDG